MEPSSSSLLSASVSASHGGSHGTPSTADISTDAHTKARTDIDYAALTLTIKAWARELGFSAATVADLDVSHAADRLQAWLAKGFHGEMDYMERHAPLRAAPATLVPGARRAIMVRMDYLDRPFTPGEAAIEATPTQGVVARYAWGRDYHKVLRQRLQTLASRIAHEVGDSGDQRGYRVFTDSAPVMEVELAQQSGLGWRGKHTLLLHRDAGSMFFIGEIFTDLPLPIDPPEQAHCGQCSRCIDVCPTQAIVAPYEVDARRCISYLTIELKGAIPLELRPLIGNRVYGCDDCQLVCPWNKFAQVSGLPDFRARHGLDGASLLQLFAWSEANFLRFTEGSAIRRIGYERWQRNVAVGLGNALRSNLPKPPWNGGFQAEAVNMLMDRRSSASALVAEHIDWALAQVTGSLDTNNDRR
jgi:epoxyqueuosine reductase